MTCGQTPRLLEGWAPNLQTARLCSRASTGDWFLELLDFFVTQCSPWWAILWVCAQAWCINSMRFHVHLKHSCTTWLAHTVGLYQLQCCPQNTCFGMQLSDMPSHSHSYTQPVFTEPLVVRPVPERSINFWQLLWQNFLQARCLSYCPTTALRQAVKDVNRKLF